MWRFFFSLALALPLAAGAQPRDLHRGLIASYALDGEATDSVTRSRGAAFATRPIDGHEGAPNTALWFDGVKSAVNLGPSIAPGRFTLSAWIRPDVVDRPQVIVSKVKNLPGHWSKNFELRLDPGGRLFLHVPNGSAWEGVAGARAIAPGRWTHVAATYDGAVGQLWVDGVRDGAPFRSAYQQSSTDVFIGARPEGGGRDGRTPGGPTYMFRGAIDDVLIWDRPLGDAEMAALRSGRLAPEPPPYAQPGPPPYPAPPPYEPPAAPPQPAALIAHFQLDGDARDAMGRVDGTLVGTRPGEDRAGDPAGALAFSGRDHVSLGVRTEPEQISIAAWIRPARAQKAQPIFSKWSEPQARREQYLEVGLDRSGRVVLALPNGSRLKGSVASRQPIPSNRWVHVAATFDGERAALYLDGAPAGQAELDAYPSAPGPVLLGARPDASGRRARSAPLFEGRMDDLRIFRGALSADEVAVLARTEPEPPPGRDRGGHGDRGDRAGDDDLLLVRIDKMLAAYDGACVRGDEDLLEKVEARIARELEEAERGFRGDRTVADRLRRASAEFRRDTGDTDAMSLDRKRTALFDLSDAVWNDLVQEFDGGPARARPAKY